MPERSAGNGPVKPRRIRTGWLASSDATITRAGDGSDGGDAVTTSATDDDVAARCHANCIEYAREGARGSRSVGEISEQGGVLLLASGSDFPVFANMAFRLDPALDAGAVIDLADGWFAQRGRGWSLGTTS